MATLDTKTAQPKERPRPIWGCVVILALAFAWRVISVTNSLRPPFPDKDKVLAAIPWGMQESDGDDVDEENYTWQDNNTIIYAVRHGKQKYQLMRQPVRNGQNTPAKPLPTANPLDRPHDLSVSPDGNWLLIGDSGLGSYDDYLIYDLNNGRLKERYLLIDSLNRWMADSQSIVYNTGSPNELMRYWVSTGKKERHTQLPIYRNATVLSSQGEYFNSYYNSWSPPHAKLKRGSIFTGKSQIRTIPTYGLVLDSQIYSVSPQGDRLLWYQVWSHTSWFDELKGKLSRQGIVPNNYEAWYVTDANGNNPRTWATLHTQHWYASHNRRISIFPKWLPDGKHLSVVYKGALYVVPIP